MKYFNKADFEPETTILVESWQTSSSAKGLAFNNRLSAPYFTRYRHCQRHYVEHFLHETKTHLPRLIELTVAYDNLQEVTQNFRRIETQRNCARVKRLFFGRSMVHQENVYRYFPSFVV